MGGEDLRLLSTKLQRAANDGQDVLKLLQMGADPNMAGRPPESHPTRKCSLARMRWCSEFHAKKRAMLTSMSHGCTEFPPRLIMRVP
jgi:hypothetical protein